MNEFEKRILNHIDKIKMDAPRQWGWRFALLDTLFFGEFCEEPDPESVFDVVIFWSKEENDKVLKKVNEEIFNDVDYKWEDMAVFANPLPLKEKKRGENQRAYSFLFDNMQRVFIEIKDWLLENGIGMVVSWRGYYESLYTVKNSLFAMVRVSGINLIRKDSKGITWKEENLRPIKTYIMKTPDFLNWFNNQDRIWKEDVFGSYKDELQDAWDWFKDYFAEYWPELRANPRKILEKFPYFKEEIPLG